MQAHALSRPLIHEALAGFSLMPEIDTPDITSLKLQVFPNPTRVSYWQKKLGERITVRVGVFISNNSMERRWPMQKWQALANSLSGKCELIFFHSPEEEFIPERRNNKNTRWVATQTVADLIAAMTQLDIVVSADSAPVHLASALQIPLVALFENRPEKYRRWHPLGVRYILLHEGRSVSDIATGSVSAAVISLLSEVNSPASDKTTLRKEKASLVAEKPAEEDVAL